MVLTADIGLISVLVCEGGGDHWLTGWTLTLTGRGPGQFHLPHFKLLDFQSCLPEKTLEDFYKFVSCPTRWDKTLDFCFGSSKDAYQAAPPPLLGAADHSCVYLMPTHQTVLKREKGHVEAVKDWTEEDVSWLQQSYY